MEPFTMMMLVVVEMMIMMMIMVVEVMVMNLALYNKFFSSFS